MRKPTGSKVVLSFQGKGQIMMENILSTLGVRTPEDIDQRILRLLDEK
jgi:hypothetical protein